MCQQLRSGLRLLDELMPQHAISSRRLAQASPAFCEVVQDLLDASRALEHWQKQSPKQDEARIADYRQLVSDLLAEARTMLERSQIGTGWTVVGKRGGRA